MLRKTTKELEDKIIDLEIELFYSRKYLRKMTEEYTTMETGYKVKLQALESENESLQHTKNTTETAENEAKMHALAVELEDVNKNYGDLNRLSTIDTIKIERFQKEIGNIKEENDKLKKMIGNKEKRMTENRRKFEWLRGLIQES